MASVSLPPWTVRGVLATPFSLREIPGTGDRGPSFLASALLIVNGPDRSVPGVPINLQFWIKAKTEAEALANPYWLKLAAYEARAVYEMTGIPSAAAWEDKAKAAVDKGKAIVSRLQLRLLSGHRVELGAGAGGASFS